ncbi:DUF4411 family protein [Sphingobacterium thalpophilum]|uniref:DUF4411 family protein n=1 Tax=Sphingobacterium thalpophilum TaxID=259 RepID=UPI0024A6F22E|nr:DUF4411 family protein [Sphingobacterium thalpophilum]
MKQYILDTNFFVQAHRAHYPFDVFPSFWSKIKELAEAGLIVSIDKVKKELDHNKDKLTEWVSNNLPDTFFQPTSETIASYSRIANWAYSRSEHYKQAALNEFLDADEADAWLVAYALTDVNNRILITHEISQPEAKSKIKIPEPCNEFGVSFKNTIEMMREIGVRF